MEYVRNREAEYDIVIVGGGLSGICAAIAAARHGAHCALIQSRPVLGGNASSEMRMHVTGASCHNGKADMTETGILLELQLENKHRNPYHSFSIWDSVLWEKTRFQENLDLYLNTTFISAKTEDHKIKEITCYQMSTETTWVFRADIFVDATGNGTLGFDAGAEYRIGSESRNEFNEPNAPETENKTTMGNTLLFIADKKDEPVPFVKPDWAYTFTEEDLRDRGHGEMSIPHGENGVREEYNADSGYWWIELGGTSKDIIGESEKITEELWKCVYGIWDHIKNCGDHGAANYALSWVGAVPGIRESRRLVGDYMLRETDISSNRIFEDAVAYGGWPMDEHPPLGLFHKGLPVRYINFPGCYSIPYRCYCNKSFDNLMMAGRDISVSKMALGSVRVMGTCAVGGQAVGTAAAIAIREKITPREVSRHMNELQQTLLKDDCYIPGYKNTDENDLVQGSIITASSNLPGFEPEKVASGVARKVGQEENAWESDGISANGEILTVKLPTSKQIREVRLTFDTNLSREIVISITRTVQERQCKYLPEELISDYDVTIWQGENEVYRKQVKDNYQRLNVLTLPEGTTGDRITVCVKKTYGYANARIFEIRAYA